MIEVAPEERRRNGATLVGLRVSDAGSGIPPENLAHIFDLIFRRFEHHARQATSNRTKIRSECDSFFRR
jgi:hypothetical protein